MPILAMMLAGILVVFESKASLNPLTTRSQVTARWFSFMRVVNMWRVLAWLRLAALLVLVQDVPAGKFDT